jgi:hypothetical protein
MNLFVAFLHGQASQAARARTAGWQETVNFSCCYIVLDVLSSLLHLTWLAEAVL